MAAALTAAPWLSVDAGTVSMQEAISGSESLTCISPWWPPGPPLPTFCLPILLGTDRADGEL